LRTEEGKVQEITLSVAVGIDFDGIKEEWAKELSVKAERYPAFLGYPEEVRRHICTTNPVESVNAGIELMRLKLGGNFSVAASLGGGPE